MPRVLDDRAVKHEPPSEPLTAKVSGPTVHAFVGLSLAETALLDDILPAAVAPHDPAVKVSPTDKVTAVRATPEHHALSVPLPGEVKPTKVHITTDAWSLWFGSLVGRIPREVRYG
jgi:hypothetical protein